MSVEQVSEWQLYGRVVLIIFFISSEFLINLCCFLTAEIKTDGEMLEDGEVNEDVAPKGIMLSFSFVVLRWAVQTNLCNFLLLFLCPSDLLHH